MQIYINKCCIFVGGQTGDISLSAYHVFQMIVKLFYHGFLTYYGLAKSFHCSGLYNKHVLPGKTF